MIQVIIILLIAGPPIGALIVSVIFGDRYRSNEEELLDWHYWAKDGWT